MAGGVPVDEPDDDAAQMNSHIVKDSSAALRCHAMLNPIFFQLLTVMLGFVASRAACIDRIVAP